MRAAFEAWAQRDGHIVRRREDKPEEYLVFETQRRWVIWQAALEHGKAPGGRKTAAQKEAAAAEKRAADALQRGATERGTTVTQDEAAVRNQVLNEVLDAFSSLGGQGGMDDILKVVNGLKKKQQEQADERAPATSKASATQNA